MSNAVMISIHPEWCDKIASGQKTIEVRKTRPKIATPFKCYIYCTKPKRYSSDVSLYTDELYRLPSGEIKFGSSVELSRFPDQWNKDNFLNGKVIGEFVCDDLIIDLKGENADVFEKQGCIALAEQKKYGGNKPLYGWHISDLVIYEKPKELVTFRKPCFNYHICEYCVLDSEKCKYAIPIERPPQSWCYVEKL